MRASLRALALLVPGILAASQAAPVPEAGARAGQFSPAEVASPAEAVRDTLSDLGVEVPSGRAVVLGIGRLATEAERAGTPHFPVLGPFNWGQEGARYGASRSGHMHEGQDVFGRTGAPLVAVSDGQVVEVGDDGGRGNYVAIFAPADRRTYVYLHMQSPSLAGTGERVRAGEQVGALGCTGSCFGDHLHFEIRRGRGTTGAPLDPLSELRRWADVHGAQPTLPPGQS
jgi:murein DD-endopeptidase MepM/ murein hydrolase activator NlpD